MEQHQCKFVVEDPRSLVLGVGVHRHSAGFVKSPEHERRVAWRPHCRAGSSHAGSCRLDAGCAVATRPIDIDAPDPGRRAAANRHLDRVVPT
jgi:hypothetical protein